MYKLVNIIKACILLHNSCTGWIHGLTAILLVSGWRVNGGSA